MLVLAASVLFARCWEIEGQRISEMNMRAPVSQANPGAAMEESQDVAAAPLFPGNPKQAMDSRPEDCDVAAPHFPHAGRGCADTMHELANSMTAVLINAQALEWRLPPYSRLKRPVREIELHARRSEALLKRLLGAFETNLREEDRQEFGRQAPSLHETAAAVTAQGPTAGGPVKLPPQMQPPSAPGPSFPPETELTSICDPCTSTFFPKEER